MPTITTSLEVVGKDRSTYDENIWLQIGFILAEYNSGYLQIH